MQKRIGLAYFPHFGGKKYFFSKIPAVILRYGSLTPCCVPETTREPIPRKLTDRRIDLIHRSLLVIAGGPIKE